MCTHVVGSENDLEKLMETGEGEITHVTVRNRYRLSHPVAKRCQFCGEVVQAGSYHTTAIVRLERTNGRPTARYPVFCDAECLDAWVRRTREKHTV